MAPTAPTPISRIIRPSMPSLMSWRGKNSGICGAQAPMTRPFTKNIAATAHRPRLIACNSICPPLVCAFLPRMVCQGKPCRPDDCKLERVAFNRTQFEPTRHALGSRSAPCSSRGAVLGAIEARRTALPVQRSVSLAGHGLGSRLASWGVIAGDGLLVPLGPAGMARPVLSRDGRAQIWHPVGGNRGPTKCGGGRFGCWVGSGFGSGRVLGRAGCWVGPGVGSGRVLSRAGF